MKEVLNKRYRRAAERGAAYVELSLSILIFLTLIICIFELLALAYRFARTQYVMSSSLRDLTFQIDQIPLTNVNDVKFVIKQAGAAFGVTLLDSEIKIQASETGEFPVAPCEVPLGAESIGNTGDYLPVCFDKQHLFFFGIYPIHIKYIGFSKREPALT